MVSLGAFGRRTLARPCENRLFLFLAGRNVLKSNEMGSLRQQRHRGLDLSWRLGLCWLHLCIMLLLGDAAAEFAAVLAQVLALFCGHNSVCLSCAFVFLEPNLLLLEAYCFAPGEAAIFHAVDDAFLLIDLALVHDGCLVLGKESSGQS
jgi:hypothetical protein